MSKPSTTAVVIWGSQLSKDHNSALAADPAAPVIMIEADGTCRKHRYHKVKLVFVLSAMRSFRDELRQAGRTVHYLEVTDCDTWFNGLRTLCRQHGIDKLVAMRQNDRSPQQRLETWCKQQAIELQTTPNDMFLTRTADFNEWAEGQKRLQMEHFYRWQRQRLDVLMQPGNKPAGGSWNYDYENRKPLPKDISLPAIRLPKLTDHSQAVISLVNQRYADHPGEVSEASFWLPTTRRQALAWLDRFIDERFANFGDYEDAMRQGETFLYHSALSAVLNIGLVHPSEVVDAALAADVPLAGKEGFIRQVIGWREFMFGLYHYKPASWRDDNRLDQRKQLPGWWWQLDGAPEPPLQDVLGRIKQYGYAHHIERLMVCGNYMLLAGYKPQAVYDWFMAMFVDAYDWVMVPNVIGMSQYADGGLDHGGFASKPYISGSNYLQKMGGWWPNGQAAKDSDWTGMYWQFLERHRDKLEQNHRLRPLYANLKKRS